MHCGYFDTTRKGNDSSFLTPTVVNGLRKNVYKNDVIFHSFAQKALIAPKLAQRFASQT